MSAEQAHEAIAAAAAIPAKDRVARALQTFTVTPEVAALMAASHVPGLSIAAEAPAQTMDSKAHPGVVWPL